VDRTLPGRLENCPAGGLWRPSTPPSSCKECAGLPETEKETRRSEYRYGTDLAQMGDKGSRTTVGRRHQQDREESAPGAKIDGCSLATSLPFRKNVTVQKTLFFPVGGSTEEENFFPWGRRCFRLVGEVLDFILGRVLTRGRPLRGKNYLF